MTERESFGVELRRARERSGLTLEAIAEQTKVGATHFAGLERADLSRWPSGIFRRAFVRSYAVAVGLDPEATVSRFSRLFPDPAGESKRAAAPAMNATAEAAVTQPAAAGGGIETDSPGARLLLVPSVPTARSNAPVARRLLAGLLDVSIAVVPAALVALAAGAHWFWPVVACIAMAGHLACYAALGTTPGGRLIGGLTAQKAAKAAEPVEARHAESDEASTPRRRAPRRAASRPVQHVHRVRH